MLESLPQPQTQAARPAQSRARGWPRVAGVLLAVGLTAAVVVHVYQGRPVGDSAPSVAEQQARVAAFVQAGVLPLPAVPAAARDEAIASMNLDAQPTETRQLLQQKSTPLAWLTLWDDQAEDGDTVEIISQGYSRTVKLTSAPIRIAVPVPPGGVINVRGVYDGGGGITLAVKTEQGSVAVPVMAVGQLIGVPVTVR